MKSLKIALLVVLALVMVALIGACVFGITAAVTGCLGMLDAVFVLVLCPIVLVPSVQGVQCAQESLDNMLAQ